MWEIFKYREAHAMGEGRTVDRRNLVHALPDAERIQGSLPRRS
ncbi:MAG: hypothetical protein NO515_06245 [Candidatus Methanomethylicia archaeon]|jgi:hypothetical protein|nr:hypothetical protein [Candidatus Methanomethylicia archaeon]MCQ5374598.1 hypothetical protein [Candidatus Methanomethylicia archaeon]